MQGLTLEYDKIGVLNVWENGKNQPESLKCLQRCAELSLKDKHPREESMVWSLDKPQVYVCTRNSGTRYV